MTPFPAQRRPTRFGRRELLLLLALIWSIASGARPAVAHGGGRPQLVNHPLGDYILSVWTLPDPLRVGTAHVTVALAQTTAGGPPQAALNREVWLTVQPADGGPAQRLAVTHANAANKLYYEVDFELPSVGEWQFVIETADQPAVTAAFSAPVAPARSPYTTPLLGGLGALALVLGWAALGRRRSSP